MKKRRKVIITNNKEIYQKFNLLHLTPEIVLKDVKSAQVNKIIDNINRDDDFLDVEVLGKNYTMVKRKKPVNFDIYLR